MSDNVLPELVTEILIRLPIKSILRFRCVCKEWCCLVSSPNFISKHLCYSSSSPSTLVRYYSKLIGNEIYALFDDQETFDLKHCTLIGFPFHDNSEFYFYFRIVGVCNGLLCLSDDLFGPTNNIIVWNPSIKCAVTLPPPLDQSSPFMSALGFGFDSESDDYKVVRVKYLFLDYNKRISHVLPPKVEVFSISSGMWRHVENNVECSIAERYWSQVVFRGAVHWVAYKLTNNDKDQEPFHNSILKFDLRTEKFVEMGLPESLASVMPINVFATMVNELFSILHTTDFKDIFGIEDRCVIWVMKEYGNMESWTPLFKLILDTGISRVLGVKRDGKLLFCGENGELVFCNPQNYEVTGGIEVCGTKHSFYVNKYVKSLVLLGKGMEVRGTEPEPDFARVLKSEMGDEAIRSMIAKQYLEAYPKVLQ